MPDIPISAPVPGGVSSTTGEGSKSIRPSVPGATPKDPSLLQRQRDAIITKEIASYKARLTVAEDEILALQSTVAELQSRDEESKKAHEEHTFRLQATEAQVQHLRGLLTVYLQSQGIRIDDLGSATTMSELVVGHSETLSAEDSSKLTDIMNESLASLYGVKKFSPKDHGRYPSVSKSHMEWPSRIEGGVRVPLHRFKWDEAYNSPLNQPTFSKWVDLSINQGP